MTTRHITLIMPGTSAEAFEAFHNHHVRLQWDTLLKVAYVEGGGTHPYVGAITANKGKGWKSSLEMKTRFVKYDPPKVAAAVMTEPTGLFALWGASMHHADNPDGTSTLNYTFSIKMRPRWFGSLLDPIAAYLFERETRKRFEAMSRFLAASRNGN
ncbi:hypothetical protein VVD49_12785 [Uliginosibacterium sp. H3]|uniref:SRPBCC family protein n=1 Tax=Uliginosibacterium silvisoli TaxID=3114758 RepID=A0ABU6K3W3_9RHOO|nr:hypothetical protein [Uliginosibacterium sp. H3]